MANPLSGNEILFPLGVAGNGQPAATTEQVTLTQLTNFENSQYVATAQSLTSNTTLTQINFINQNSSTPPASFTLSAGGVYMFDIYLSVTNNASGGLKLALGGTATATTFAADTWAYNTTTVAAQGNITSLSSNLVALTGAITTVNVTGTIAVNAGGTFYLQFAQNASYATATTINAGSNFWVDRIV